jgi:E3 ubiquitin-protein ligase BRE1
MAEFLTHSCSTKSDYLPINLIMPVGVILMEVSFTGVLLTRERSTKKIDGRVMQSASSEFPSSLLFDDVATFSGHLKEKQVHITSSLNALFKSLKSTSSDHGKSDKVDALQARLSSLLASEKAHKVEITRLMKEKEDANARLTEATIKYMTAEKKVDRLKSQTLAKIERQAMFHSNTGPDSKKEGGTSDEQSAKDHEINAKVAEGNVADAEQARKEAQAIACKQKEELQQLQTDNTRLSEKVTTFTIKVFSPRVIGRKLMGHMAY